MSDVLSDIDALFGQSQLPRDDTGLLATAGPLLPDIAPEVLIIADSAGAILAVDTRDPEDPVLDRIHTLVERASVLARQHRVAVFDPALPPAPRRAFGVQLFPAAGDVFLIGLVAPDRGEAVRAAYAPLVAWGLAVWAGIYHGRQCIERDRRIRHMQLEQDTLKRTHANAVAAVIEEREERIRQQREYVVELEGEVERRSAALREAMLRAQQANESKSSFLANMSHEIRTPMTAILGYADILNDQAAGHPTIPGQREALETIRRNGTYLLDLINDILDLAKVESGKLVCEKLATGIVELVSDVVDLMRVRADGKGLALGAQFVTRLPEVVYTDPTRVRQILVNLVGNAIKFTRSGGVRIDTSLIADGANSYIQLDVIDSGIGLDGDQIGRLFDPFAQADASTTRQHGGTGLGLALSRRLARALGGDITVTSTPGGGSCFRVLISAGDTAGVQMVEVCRTPAHADTLEGRPEQGELARLDGRSILLAEDGADNRRLLSYILTHAGAEVTVVENGQQAVDAALASRRAGQPYDMILMDMQMPVMDGYDATRMLRKLAYEGTVIAITAHAMATDRDRCLQAGCDDYVTKPIHRATLLANLAATAARLPVSPRA